MRNLLFASVRDGNMGAENIWMVYKSNTSSLLVLSAMEAAEAKEYALTSERTVYRKDLQQVAYVNKAVIMGRGKAGVTLVLDFDAVKESDPQRYAAEIIGAPCPAWLNMESVVTTQDAEKYLSDPNIYDDWVSQSEVKQTSANQKAVLALIDAIVKGDNRPILLYSSRSVGSAPIPSEVYAVLKAALLSLPVAIANDISFSTYTELERDLNGMDVVCVSGRGMEMNAAWKELYTAIDIANVVCEQPTFYVRLLAKGLKANKKLPAPLSDITNMADLEREAAKELFHAMLDEIGETCEINDLKNLYKLYIQRKELQATEEKRPLCEKLNQSQVVFDNGSIKNALIYWLEELERVLPLPGPLKHCDLSAWNKGRTILSNLDPKFGHIAIDEFRRIEEDFIEKCSPNDLKNAGSDKFYIEAKRLGLLDLDEIFRNKFIDPPNLDLIGKELGLAQKYFYCSGDEIRTEFCTMLLNAKQDWRGNSGDAVALLSWMRAYRALPEKILDDVKKWASAKREYERYCADDKLKRKFCDSLLKKCEGELTRELGADHRQCEKKWEDYKKVHPDDAHAIETDFGFDIEAYEKKWRMGADKEFRDACKAIWEVPDQAESKIEETRLIYKLASDKARKAAFLELFGNQESRTAAAYCVITWEDLPQEVKSASELAPWKKILQDLKDYLGKNYSEWTEVLSQKFKDMCCNAKIGAGSILNVLIEIVKAVEDLANEELIKEQDKEDIKKSLFNRCDGYFKTNLNRTGSISPAMPERESVYRDLIEYGYHGKYEKDIRKELDRMQYASIEGGLKTSCDEFYRLIKERNPDAEEETGATKAARRREAAQRVAENVCKFVVWLAIVAAGVALIYVLCPLILKWIGIADTVEVALSVLHLQFLNEPILWSGIAAIVYLLTSVYHLVMHEKAVDGWKIIGKSSRNMLSWVLIPYVVAFAVFVWIFVQ